MGEIACAHHRGDNRTKKKGMRCLVVPWLSRPLRPKLLPEVVPRSDVQGRGVAHLAARARGLDVDLSVSPAQGHDQVDVQ